MVAPVVAAALVKSGSDLLGKAVGGPAGPSQATASNTAGFDNSGFNVSFGGDASSSASQGFPPWLIAVGIGAAALAAIVWIKKK